MTNAKNGIRHTRYRIRQAQILRSSGWSVKRIAKRLQISSSTASRWVRKVVLTDGQRENLKKNCAANRVGLGARILSRSQEKVARWSEEARELWERWQREPLFVLGVGLYWGEGTKAYRKFAVTNSDPAAIQMWIRWCRKYIPDGELRIVVTYPSSADGEVVRDYWTQISGQSGVAVYPNRSTVQSPVRRTRLLPYGTAQVCLRRGSSEWWIKMMEWIRLSSGLK